MAKKKYSRPKPIYVKWLDHYSHRDGWAKADYTKAREGLECESVGFLIYESPKTIHLALNYCFKEEESESADSMCILKSCIVKKRFLK